MATRGGLAEWKQTHGKKKAKYVLTSTGLLMEGTNSILNPWILSYGLAVRPAHITAYNIEHISSP